LIVARGGERLVSARTRRDDLQIGMTRKEMLQALQHDRVVVGQDNADGDAWFH
jgi:hypothetical protein